MKRFLILFICVAATLSAEKRIEEGEGEVNLIIEDKYNEKGHDYGDDFFARNRGGKAVRFVIRMTDSFNAANRLTENTLILEPGDTAYLGSILQKDLSQEANWSYEWEVKPD